MKSKEEVTKIINEVIDTLRPIVDKIEKSVPETKGHYGKYVTIISQAPEEKRKSFAALLVKAGANIEGVADALKIVLN